MPLQMRYSSWNIFLFETMVLVTWEGIPPFINFNDKEMLWIWPIWPFSIKGRKVSFVCWQVPWNKIFNLQTPPRNSMSDIRIYHSYSRKILNFSNTHVQQLAYLLVWHSRITCLSHRNLCLKIPQNTSYTHRFIIYDREFTK